MAGLGFSDPFGVEGPGWETDLAAHSHPHSPEEPPLVPRDCGFASPPRAHGARSLPSPLGPLSTLGDFFQHGANPLALPLPPPSLPAMQPMHAGAHEDEAQGVGSGPNNNHHGHSHGHGHADGSDERAGPSQPRVASGVSRVMARRHQNKVLARKSRLRKRLYLDALQKKRDALAMEHAALSARLVQQRAHVTVLAHEVTALERLRTVFLEQVRAKAGAGGDDDNGAT